MGEPIPTVTKQFHFHAAHSLPGVPDCQQVHGHTYHVDVEVQSETKADGPEQGMVINARDLKSVVNEVVVDRLDHAYLASGDEPILPALHQHGYRVVEIGRPTTAENLSRWMMAQLVDAGLPITRVRVWETDSMHAEVTREAEGNVSIAADTANVRVDAGEGRE